MVLKINLLDGTLYEFIKDESEDKILLRTSLWKENLSRSPFFYDLTSSAHSEKRSSSFQDLRRFSTYRSPFYHKNLLALTKHGQSASVPKVMISNGYENNQNRLKSKSSNAAVPKFLNNATEISGNNTTSDPSIIVRTEKTCLLNDSSKLNLCFTVEKLLKEIIKTDPLRFPLSRYHSIDDEYGLLDQSLLSVLPSDHPVPLDNGESKHIILVRINDKLCIQLNEYTQSLFSYPESYITLFVLPAWNVLNIIEACVYQLYPSFFNPGKEKRPKKKKCLDDFFILLRNSSINMDSIIKCNQSDKLFSLIKSFRPEKLKFQLMLTPCAFDPPWLCLFPSYKEGPLYVVHLIHAGDIKMERQMVNISLKGTSLHFFLEKGGKKKPIFVIEHVHRMDIRLEQDSFDNIISSITIQYLESEFYVRLTVPPNHIVCYKEEEPVQVMQQWYYRLLSSHPDSDIFKPAIVDSEELTDNMSQISVPVTPIKLSSSEDSLAHLDDDTDIGSFIEEYYLKNA